MKKLPRNVYIFTAGVVVVGVVSVGILLWQALQEPSLSTHDLWIAVALVISIASMHAFYSMQRIPAQISFDFRETALFPLMFLFPPAQALGFAIFGTICGTFAEIYLRPKLFPVKHFFNISLTFIIFSADALILTLLEDRSIYFSVVTAFVLNHVILEAVMVATVTIMAVPQENKKKKFISDVYSMTQVDQPMTLALGFVSAALISSGNWVALVVPYIMITFTVTHKQNHRATNEQYQLKSVFEIIHDALKSDTPAEIESTVVTSVSEVLGGSEVAIMNRAPINPEIGASIAANRWIVVTPEAGIEGEREAFQQQFVSSVADLTKAALERATLTEQARNLSLHDGLTGLPNRRLFEERFKAALAAAERHERKCAVLFVDLDGFKPINDTLGHDAGDTVLQEVGNRLRRVVRHEDTVARFGGDEFLVLLTEVDDKLECEAAALRVEHAFREPFTAGNEKLPLGASIGMAVYPEDGVTCDELINVADRVMYTEKRRRKNPVRSVR